MPDAPAEPGNPGVSGPTTTVAADPLLVARARLVARIAGVLVSAIGAVLLAAQLLAPGMFHAGVGTARASMALGFALAGAALYASVETSAHARAIARGLNYVLIGVALATLALASDRVGPAGPAGFLLVGTTLWLMLDERLPKRAAQGASAVVAVLAMTVLMGLAYGVQSPMFSRDALPRQTSIGFLIVCAGLLAARAEDGPVSLLVQRGLGGAVTRGVMIPTLFLLACLRVFGQRSGLWDSPVGLAVMVSVSLSFATYLIVRTAAHLDRTDRERQTALEELQLAHDELEVRVEERTRELRASEAAMAIARDAAVQASKAKSEFLAAMSHELRTPLNAVIGVAWLLEQTELTDEQRQHAQLIRSGGMQLLAVINDVLDLSKIEAGKLQLVSDAFSPRALVTSAVRLLAPRAAEKRLALTESIAAGVPESLVGDEGRIRQVLLNLLGNAVKFTERGSVEVIATCEPGPKAPRLMLKVRDTGIGIAADKLSMVFERFTQADASTTRRYGGTGLGLNISQQLVQLMGGTIHVTSQPGEGSEFWFTLDLDPGAARVPAAAVAELGAAPAVRVRALVVEDDDTNQFVARRMLELLGCQVEIAPSGAEALARVAARAFDIIYMDCQMPEMDGYETTARIRALGPGVTSAKVPIVGLTAYAMPDDRQKCLDAGMDDYLAKPVSWERLRGTLTRWLPPAGVPSAPPPSPPAEPQVPSSKTLDPARLAFLTSLDGDQRQGLLGELVRMFGDTTTALLEELKRAVAAGDTRAIRRLRHKLQGSCLNMGAASFAAAAASLPEDPPPDAAALARWLESLDREFATVRSELARLTD